MIKNKKFILCKSCRNKIANANINKETEKDIFIDKKDNLSIKVTQNSIISRCNKCNQLIGIKLKSTNNFMIFKEKISYKNK